MAGALRGITVEIGGDTTKLGNALKGVSSQAKSLQSELKGVNTLLKMDPSNTTLLTQKQSLLAKSITTTKQKLDTLKDAEKQAQKQFEKGDISEEQYRDLQREIVATEQKLESLTNEMKEFGSVGAQQVKQVGEKMKDVGGKVEAFGKGFSVVSAGAGAVMAGSIAAFVELDEGYDTIIAKTGATGEALDELNKVADNIFGDMPVDMNTVGVAVGEINTRFGYTGDKLEGLSRQFIQFSEINAVDLNTSIGTTDKVLEQFNMDASEAGNVLDLVTKKAQETGIGADKLLNSIQENGATFKDMGLGVNESIVMLAQFEANGVNVEQALKGLKKATTEYADEGLSMTEGLSKTIKQIKTAKTDTEALAIAQEVFGIRGAGEMAKAIRENRLSVEDLSAAMNTYSGTVANTFDATLDPIDNAKVAMNNLKLAGSELGGVLQSVFAPMLTSLVQKLKDLATGFGNLPSSVQSTIAIVLSVTAVLGPLIIGIGKLITAFGTIMTTAPKVVSAFSALKGVIVANPWVALATAIGAVVAALVLYSSQANKTKSDTDILIEKTDAFNKKVSEQSKAYEEAQAARTEAMSNTTAEFGYYQQLTDELNGLIDANGKVKSGYETRAQVITGILSDALGTEISLDQAAADGKQKLIDKINELIQVKQANAILSQSESGYTEAITKSQGALNTYVEAQNNHKKVKDELTKAEEEYSRILALQIEQESKGSGRYNKYDDDLAAATRTREKLTQAEKDASKALTDSQNIYLGYQNTIKNYEGLSAAIIEGDTGKINNAVMNMTNNFITAENGTKQSLEKQVTNAKTNLKNLETAFKEGAPGVTQQMVNNAKTMVTKSEAELKKLPEKGKKAGEDTGKKTAEGIKSKEGEVKAAAKKTADSAGKELDKTKDKAKKAGSDAGQAKADGLKSKEGAVKTAAKKVTDSAGKELDKAKGKGSAAGSGGGQAMASGLSSKNGAVATAAFSLTNSANGRFKLLSGQAQTSGSNASGKFASGISSGSGTASNAANTVATSAKSQLDGIDTSSAGANFTAGFASGIESGENGLLAKIREMAKKALSALKEALGINSPAKEVIPFGEGYVEGFEVGVENETPKAAEAVEGFGETMLDRLNKKLDYVLNTDFEDYYKEYSDKEGGWIAKNKAWVWFNQLNKAAFGDKQVHHYMEEAIDYANELDSVLGSPLEKIKAIEEEMSIIPYTFDAHNGAANSAIFKEFRDSLDHQREWNLISEEDYYHRLEILRNKFLAKHSIEHREVSKEIYDYNKGLLAKEEENVKETYDNMASYIEDKLGDIVSARESMSDKLGDYGGLYNSVKINLGGKDDMSFLQLADIDAQTELLRQYSDLLTKVQNRGEIPSEIMDTLREMSVEEGMSFANALLAASDAEFNAYIESWKEKQALADEIATSLYTTDAENIVEEFTESFEKLDDEFFGAGEDSAVHFGDGFRKSIEEIMNNVRESIRKSFSGLFDDLTSASVTVVSDGGNIPQMATGGIIDRPTIVQAGENGKEAIVPLENNTNWINAIADKFIARTPSRIVINNDNMLDKLDRIYERLDRMQIVLDSGALVGETIDRIDAGLADRQLLSARGL